ncbi:MAG: phage tail sheath subtilisin-like domain-containing protein [Dehalobacter sp.]|nr:phage tail sheath subtilisin-like domain-containing protein [Dehalobacter sp.]
MPEYLAPGVYIEEFELGARPIEGVSTSTVGFLGLTERGPTKPPILIDSFEKFARVYGSYIQDSYLAYAVQGFFENGGKRCYIGRVTRVGANSASLTEDELTFKAVGEGSWGNRVGVRIENSSSNPDDTKSFKLTLVYWQENKFPENFNKPDIDPERKLRELFESSIYIESFDDLSEDKKSPDHYLRKMGDPLKNVSNLVVLSGSGRPPNTEEGNVLFKTLDGGLDAATSPPGPVPAPISDGFLGDAAPGERTGLRAFEDIDEISIIYAPDLHWLDKTGFQTAAGNILTQCETLKDRFAIFDAGQKESNISSITIQSVLGRQSKYGAIYYPWIKVYDPLTQQLKEIPPGGHIAGIYARSDNERGVHKAPANEYVKGAIDLKFLITKGEQEILNPKGINVIRNFPGRGILLWGARTAIIDPLWKYINVRRLFIYIEESIEEGTQWVVFEPNNEKLWARVTATITQFLTGVWRDGALMGTKPEEAFFVKCDRTTMTQDDIDNGRLICIIGIAPVKPAEFVIFKIAQWAGGSAATE